MVDTDNKSHAPAPEKIKGEKPEKPPAPKPRTEKPQKPQLVGGGKKDLLVEEVIAPPLLDLKRPAPPRNAKTGKKWQEEEIIDELKEKSKVGIKSKRVKPILEDDFEDDDD